MRKSEKIRKIAENLAIFMIFFLLTSTLNVVNAKAATCYTKTQTTKKSMSFLIVEKAGITIVELLNVTVAYAESYYTNGKYRTYYDRNFWYTGTVVGDYRKPVITYVKFPYHYNTGTGACEMFNWSTVKDSLFPVCDYKSEITNDTSKIYYYATARQMVGKWSLGAMCNGAVKADEVHNSMSLSFK